MEREERVREREREEGEEEERERKYQKLTTFYSFQSKPKAVNFLRAFLIPVSGTINRASVTTLVVTQSL